MSSPWFDPVIKAAKAGDDVAARALVRCLAECLERGVVPPAALAAYFASALKQIADGHKADEALNTDGKSSASFEEYCAITREVWKLNHRAVDPLPLKSDKKISAFKIVGDEHHVSAHRIQQIYWEFKERIEAELLDQQFANPKQFKVDLHIAIGQLAETLKKQRGSAFAKLIDALKNGTTHLQPIAETKQGSN